MQEKMLGKGANYYTNKIRFDFKSGNKKQKAAGQGLPPASARHRPDSHNSQCNAPAECPHRVYRLTAAVLPV